MRILFSALFCSLLCSAPASAQSSIAGASGEAAAAASAEAPRVPIKPVKPIRSEAPIATARGKTIELGLGYSYLSQPGNQSNRSGLRGPDASFTIGLSRLGITADVGYAQASNVLGTGRNSVVLSYLVGPVFHHTVHRSFATYVHALVGGAKVSGPVLTNKSWFFEPQRTMKIRSRWRYVGAPSSGRRPSYSGAIRARVRI